MVRSKKELEILLSNVPQFREPSAYLEQYTCDSSVASDLIWFAYMRKDIEGKVVVDLGCGTGILSYGALLMGAKEVLCIDIDTKALRIAKNFLSEKDLIMFDTINADVEYLHLRGVDTVIMNPPFGVHRKGIDLVFLRKALELNPNTIYTVHKYNLESHNIISKTVAKSSYTITNMVVRSMCIPALFPTHRRRVHRFKVALYTISKVVMT